MIKNHSHFIAGKWLPGKGTSLISFDPSNEQIVWEGHAATDQEVNAAVLSARKAFIKWALLPLSTRIQHLEAFGKVLASHKDQFARAISQETGKPLWDALGEVAAMINKIGISIEAYGVRCAERIKDQPQGTSICRHKPHGIMAIFGPFNFPGHLPNGHIIPALLAGNTIIFKPSEETPHVGELMGLYWQEAGLPPGVFNLLQGGKDTGIFLANHADIDGLLFTGSWQTGQLLADKFARHPQKILALEMGGNNPLIISNVSDIKLAAYLTIQSAFITSGQRCTCARRLILPPTKQSDTFLEELIHLTKSIVVGAYSDTPEPFMGPVVSAAAAKRLIEQQQELLDLGGHPLLPMSRLTRGPAYLIPGIIDMTQVKRRPDIEIFGPLLQIVRTKNFQEAISEANCTEYGLTAGLFSDSEKEYQEFYTHIKAGVVNWNVQLTGASSAAPFGGIGKSGNHRPSAFYAADYCAYPVASLENFTLNWPKTITPGISR